MKHLNSISGSEPHKLLLQQGDSISPLDMAGLSTNDQKLCILFSFNCSSAYLFSSTAQPRENGGWRR